MKMALFLPYGKSLDIRLDAELLKNMTLGLQLLRGFIRTIKSILKT